jgi:ribosomal protein S18 acetylase RimI-like enzyme
LTTAARRRIAFDAVPDAWLGGILGRPALRLVPAALPDPDWIDRLRNEDLFVTAKIATSDVAGAIALQQLGFQIVDVLLSFDGAPAPGPASERRVRPARAGDRDKVVLVAATSFQFTRFHLDPAIPKPLAARIKAAWAGNYFDGARGDGMVVAEQDGVVVGFLQLLWSGNQLVVDLIAVAPEAARRGLARAMIGFAAAKGTGDGRRPAGLIVGTQAANVPSVRLYESLGFRLKQSQFVLHHHGRDSPYSTMPER